MNGPPDHRDLDYFPPPGEPWPNGLDAQPPKFRHIINPADWEGLLVPPREWIVPGYIPHKTITSAFRRWLCRQKPPRPAARGRAGAGA